VRMPDDLPLERTSFVGREKELAEARRLLSERRLLTLSGPGGAGKTRLALAVAREVGGGFERGAWWIELAPLSDPELVPRAAASALGVSKAPDLSPTEALVKHLEFREILLVLDNCEHLIEACAELADALLGSCPELKILATSREPLRVAGETNFVVPSLSLPDPGRLPAAGELADYEAVHLFVERARAVDAGFGLTEEKASTVVRLCQKLDGIPLAIELAAARVRVLTVEQILGKLDDPLGLLTKGSRTAAARHRTLRATLGWSYDLLSDGERVLLGRLSVFAGGFTLEAAEAVCAGEGIGPEEVLDLLASLVDKSLVTVPQRDGEARYGMLEPVRQFGREKLYESGEAEETRRRHTEHYLALAEKAEPELVGADQGLWLGRLRTEIGNLRAALSWSLEPGDEGSERARLGLRLVAALGRFWDVQGLEEGKGWLEVALERAAGRYPAVRAKALSGLGWILLFQQDYARAITVLEEAVALHKELGDESGAALALGNLGYAVLHGGFRERVPAFVEEGEALMRGDLEGHPRAFLRLILASAPIGEGDLDSAVSQLEESLALCRELGDMRVAAISLHTLGMIELMRGNLDRGAATLEEGARITQELKDRPGIAYHAWALGEVNALRGRPVRAARLWGAAEALREQMGTYLSQFDLAQSRYEQGLADVRAALSEASFDAAWAEGRTMSAEQAIEYAIEYALEGPAVPDEEVRAEVSSAAHPPAGRSKEDIHPPVLETPVLRIFALGPARVEREGLSIDSPDWTQKPKELLYYLLSHPEGRTKEQVGLALWPEASTAQLRSSFHDTVFRLRRALGGKEWVAFEKRRYGFGRTLSYSYDVEDFEGNLTAARRLRDEAPEQAIVHLQEAASLYGGDFLEDLAESEWALERQDELRRAHGESLLLLGELLVARGRHTEAADAYRQAISHDRFLEEAHRGLMRSQVAMGERGQALRHYEGLVGLLEVELGSPPAPETTALHERLRSGQGV
jgi:predicted ATPase/DNA-binding SARP family transcriptional activator